jgi:hypothetical protein
MKLFRLIAGITFLLFIIGLFSGSLMLELTKKILDINIDNVGRYPFTSVTPQFSFGFLLDSCSLSAGGLLWAYSKRHSKYDSKVIFGLGLLISITSGVTGIGLKLLELRNIFISEKELIDHFSLAAEAFNYFSWGIGLVLFVNVILIALLLWFPPQRQKEPIVPT